MTADVARAGASPTRLPDRGPGPLGRLADSERWMVRLMLTPAIVYIVALVGFPFLLSLFAGARAIGMRSVRYRGLADDPASGPEADLVIDDHRELPALVAALD